VVYQHSCRGASGFLRPIRILPSHRFQNYDNTTTRYAIQREVVCHPRRKRGIWGGYLSMTYMDMSHPRHQSFNSCSCSYFFLSYEETYPLTNIVVYIYSFKFLVSPSPMINLANSNKLRQIHP
jgi:hypothetical protein